VCGCPSVLQARVLNFTVHKEAPVAKQYVCIDLHKRRSVIVQVNDDRTHGPAKRLANSPQALVDAVGCAGPGAEVVI
jgi:hypothetical protein